MKELWILTGILWLSVAGVEAAPEGDPLVPVSIPVSAEAREVVEGVMIRGKMPLLKFVQFFGIIAYEGSELAFDKEEPLLVGKMARSQALLLVHLASSLSSLDKEQLRQHIKSIFGEECEFCLLPFSTSEGRLAPPVKRGACQEFSFSRIASTS